MLEDFPGSEQMGLQSVRKLSRMGFVGFKGVLCDGTGKTRENCATRSRMTYLELGPLSKHGQCTDMKAAQKACFSEDAVRSLAS